MSLIFNFNNISFNSSLLILPFPSLSKIAKEGTLIVKPIYSYRVQCTELKSDVRRTYADFEWLKNQLGSYYALRVVPPIMKEAMYFQLDIVNKKDTEETIEKAKVKYLNYFMNSLIKKKIFRTSAILYEFLARAKFSSFT